MNDAGLDEPDGWQIARRPLSPLLKLLCVGPQEPSWINLTLQLDAEGCHQPQFRWVSTGALAIKLSRSETFDCILVCGESAPAGQAVPQPAVAPLRIVEALRSSGCETPLVVISTRASDREWEEAIGLQCELLVTPSRWDSPVLVRMIKRAMERMDLLREHRRLAADQQRRLQRDRAEAEQLLYRQRAMAEELRGFGASLRSPANPSPPDHVFPGMPGMAGPNEAAPATHSVEQTAAPLAEISLPPDIDRYYQELLRTYVIMGSGSLGSDIKQLAEILAEANFSPQHTLAFHLQRVETLVRGLGQRSSRHVMDRADLLLLELLIHLGECYQQRANGAARVE